MPLRIQVFWDVTTWRLVNYRLSNNRSAFIFRTKKFKDCPLGQLDRFPKAVISELYSKLLITAAVIPALKPLVTLGLINKTVGYVNILRAKCPPTVYN